MSAGWTALEKARHGETLESPAARLRTPYVSEFDLDYFRRLRHRDLARAAAELSGPAGEGDPVALARRGRVRRITGDAAGAARDLREALRLRPGLLEARAWLAELDLAAPGAEDALAEAVRRRPREASFAAWLGMARLEAGRPGDAARGLAASARGSRSALLWFLLGVARERAGAAAAARRAYAEAARLEPYCSAAHWLISRLSRGAKALKAAEGALQAQPGYAFLAQFMLAEEGSWGAAIARLRTFALNEPEKALWYDRQDDLTYSPLHEEERLDALKMSRRFPGAPWVLAMAGRAGLRCPQGSPHREPGARMIERAARDAARGPWMLAWRGLAKLSRGDERGALADFDRSLAASPWYLRAYAWRGALLTRMGRLAEAEADLDRSIALDEGYVFAYHQRSLARRGLGDWLGAAADLGRAFEGDARYHWAFSTGRDPRPEDFASAGRELDRAARAFPDSSEILAWRGENKRRAGDASGALADLERAAAIDPSNALALACLGRTFLAAGRAARAAALLRRAQEIRPALETYVLWRAEAEHAAGRRREALALLASPPAGRQGYDMLITRARLRLDGGDARGALKDADACLAIRGRSAEVYYVRALAQMRLGDAAGALASTDMALYASERHGLARLLRAEALRRLGRAEESVGEYGRVLERHPFLLNEEQRIRWNDLIAA